MLHIVAEAQEIHGLDPEPHGRGGDLPYVLPRDELLLLAKYEVNWSMGLAMHGERTNRRFLYRYRQLAQTLVRRAGT